MDQEGSGLPYHTSLLYFLYNTCRRCRKPQLAYPLKPFYPLEAERGDRHQSTWDQVQHSEVGLEDTLTFPA